MTPHPKLSRLTPPERVTTALVAVGGIRGLLAAVKTSGHNANSRRAYVGAFDALADAVAEAEREAFRRGQVEMRGRACLAFHENADLNAPPRWFDVVKHVEALPILDAPPEAKEKT